MNRTPEQWAKVSANAVVGGSSAQARNVLEMALQDIAQLSRDLEALDVERNEQVTSAVNAGCLYGFGEGVKQMEFKEEIEPGRFVDVDPIEIMKTIRSETIEECAQLADRRAQSVSTANARSACEGIAAALRAAKESDGGVEAQRHAAPMASVPAGETSGSDGVAAIPSEMNDLQVWLRHGRIGAGRGYQAEVERARQIEAAECAAPTPALSPQDWQPGGGT